MDKLERINFLPVKDLHDTMIFLATEMNKIIEAVNRLDGWREEEKRPESNDQDALQKHAEAIKKAFAKEECDCPGCQMGRELMGAEAKFKEKLKKIMGVE